MDIFNLSRKASALLKRASTEDKNNAIKSVSRAIKSRFQEILDANAIDVELQKSLGTSPSLIDRLTLTKQRIEAICADMLSVANLPDPVGEVLDSWTTDNGLLIKKVSVPYGIIGVIYEARPNVTVDVFTLCIKSGNCCLLKGGSDAENSNVTIVEIIRDALEKTAIPKDSVILMPSDRESTKTLINARGKVELIVPRGSKQLIRYVTENSLVPVIETGAGVCHVYVHEKSDLNEAVSILRNAKLSRPSVCNACETLVVDKNISSEFLKTVKSQIPEIMLRGDDFAMKSEGLLPLTADGYFAEYSSNELSVVIKNDIYEAVEHINTFGTHHSDCICTKDNVAAEYFLTNVDSACVYVNASTRFSDGGCFGFGAELGISTQKNHPRGPIGLKEMTCYHYKIYGKGQVR